mgnify:CR=1 FL=1
MTLLLDCPPNQPHRGEIAKMMTAAARMEVPTGQLKEFTLLASEMATAFDAVPDELTDEALVVEGAIPPELDGWYLRNGPNPRQPTGHWFTGDGMIHGVRIEGGAAKWYRNRWIRTDSFTDPFPLYNDDGTRSLNASVAASVALYEVNRSRAALHEGDA